MENLSFEILMENIKKIVKEMEEENLEIDKAIKLFEDGVKYTTLADKKINDIKNKVIKIVRDNKMDDFKKIDNNEKK